MSKIADQWNDAKTTENNTTNTDATNEGARATYEAYTVMGDFRKVLNAVLKWAGENVYEAGESNDRVPDDAPIMSVVETARHLYGGDEGVQLGNRVGDGPLKMAEFEEKADEIRAVEAAPVGEAHPDYADELEIDEGRMIPVVDGTPVAVSVDSDEGASEAVDALETFATRAVEDDTPLPDSDDGKLKKKWDADDETGDATSDDATPESDLNQKDAVIKFIAEADDGFKAQVMDGGEFRKDVQMGVEERFGKHVAKDYISKIAAEWRDKTGFETGDTTDDTTDDETGEDAGVETVDDADMLQYLDTDEMSDAEIADAVRRLQG